MSSSALSAFPSPSTDLASLYECPVCFEYIFPPILQCANGHMVCSSCSPKLNCCPSCKGRLGTCRNLALEKALSSVQFPCKFSTEGCQITMLLTEKIAHEEHCLLRPFCCCPCCNWQGAVDQFLPHIRSKHPTMEQTEGDHFIYRLGSDSISRFGDGHQWAKLLHCYGQRFLFILRKEKKETNNDRFLATVQLIGTGMKATNFSYRINLSGRRNKMMWEATPLSIHDNLKSAAAHNGCFVFENADADGQPFSRNGYLNIDVEVVQYSRLSFSEVFNGKTCYL